MKPTILTGIVTWAALSGALMAQQQPPAGQQPAGQQAPPGQQQPAGPKVKSQAEGQAVNALIQARSSGPDAIIKAADDLVTKFSDTEFKELAFTFEANAYQQKGDFAKAEVFDEEILKINPKNTERSSRSIPRIRMRPCSWAS
jgi:hypothetical protein